MEWIPGHLFQRWGSLDSRIVGNLLSTSWAKRVGTEEG